MEIRLIDDVDMIFIIGNRARTKETDENRTMEFFRFFQTNNAYNRLNAMLNRAIGSAYDSGYFTIKL
jgi:hypothetical protein